jgi:hypothetical protein
VLGNYTFQPYAAGNKTYGMLRNAPNVGPVGASGMMGYKERDAMAQTKKDALLRRMKAQNKGQMMQPDVLRSLG